MSDSDQPDTEYLDELADNPSLLREEIEGLSERDLYRVFLRQCGLRNAACEFLDNDIHFDSYRRFTERMDRPDIYPASLSGKWRFRFAEALPPLDGAAIPTPPEGEVTMDFTVHSFLQLYAALTRLPLPTCVMEMMMRMADTGAEGLAAGGGMDRSGRLLDVTYSWRFETLKEE